MKWFSQHWRQWLRRWRLPEMRLLFLALLVSAVAVSAVGFFTDRVNQAMERQATQLMGGDLVLSSSRPLPDSYRQKAAELGVQLAEVIRFSSMVSVGDKTQLVQIKAVSPTYPLLGQLEGTSTLGSAGQLLQGETPERGSLWAEPRLFNELGLQTGQTVQLGRKTVVLDKVLTKDPGQSMNVFQLSATALLPLADLAETGLLSPASRAEFMLLYSGSSADIRQLRKQLKPLLQASEKIRSLEEGAPTVEQSLQRAGRFLGLAALLSVVLAGAAIALAANGLVQHETRAVAVLKAFGLPRRQILLDYLSNLWLVALVAGSLGVLIGAVLQLGLAAWLGRFIDIVLPAPRLYPLLTGLFTALVMVTGFAVPYLLRMLDTPPVQILQGQLQAPRPQGRILLAIMAVAVFILFWVQAGELLLAVWLWLGVLAAIVVFWLGGQLLLRLLANAGARWSVRPGWGWLGFFKHARRSSLLLTVFSVGLFTLLLLLSLRTDLLGRWQASLPPDAPNQFLINIQPNEVAPLQAFLEREQLKAELYPMIRGRLVEVNGKPIRSDAFTEDRAKRLLEREFNLSAFARLPESNTLLAGQWFDGKTQQGFSIEKGIGETLGFGMGDTLSFDIAGQRFTETVTSVREVKWDSMRPNFFVIAAPQALDDKPRTFITSLHVPPDRPELIPSLIRQFPGVTAIDSTAILTQVRTLIGHASFAVQGIFAFSLVAGIVVLLAALQGQRPERQREMAILKSLGAGQALLQRRIWLEFVLLGAMAGVLGGLIAMIASNLLGYFLFDLGFSVDLTLLLLGMVAGGLLVGGAAWLNLRRLLTVPPVVLLQG